MKTGSLVYATDQGLGILAKSFHDHGVVTDVMVIRHGRRPEHDDWYPGAPRVAHLRNPVQVQEMKDFCARMDVMLFFETPFVWELIDHCRVNGVKTALMVMHECLHQNVRRYQPDLLLCPSLLDQEAVKEWTYEDCRPFIPVPVDVPWRKRERAEVFVHNAGWGGLKGRNGTRELLIAMRYVESPIKLIVRSQSPIELPVADWRVHVFHGTFPQETLWEEGGVFVFPERFNGLSLPLQEARAAGMLVMCGNHFPMNCWLPREPLIPVAGEHRERIGPPYIEYDCAEFDPRAIAAKIDEWYGKDISEYSEQGKAWAASMSWEALKPKYIEVLENLLR